MAIDPELHLRLATTLAAAVVGNAGGLAGGLGLLMRECYAAVANAATPEVPAEPEHPKASAREIRVSIQPDFLTSFEDGKKYKSLKRHLAGRGLTPDEYRAKWGLPADYPMVSPNYSATRSQLAKNSGLGRN